jgi:two-component sensor histidine kinase
MIRERQLRDGQIVILTMIAQDLPLRDISSAVVALAESIEPSAVAVVSVLDQALRSLENAFLPPVHGASATAFAKPPLEPPDEGACAEALRRGVSVTSEDLGRDTRFSKEWLEQCADRGFRSCHLRPLLDAEGAPLATFMLFFLQARSVEHFDAQLINACAKLLELALTRRRVGERHELVLGEMEHRVKNLLATVSALAQVSVTDMSSRTAFQGRLAALATAQSMLFAADGIDLGSLLRQVLRPYDNGRIAIDGPVIALTAEATSSLGMAMHELATNAAKYGSLSTGQGRVNVTWEVSSVGQLSLQWAEGDGPRVAMPLRRGFGLKTVERLLANQIEGTVHFDFDPSGLRCRIEAELGDKIGRLVPGRRLSYA